MYMYIHRERKSERAISTIANSVDYYYCICKFSVFCGSNQVGGM